MEHDDWIAFFPNGRLSIPPHDKDSRVTGGGVLRFFDSLCFSVGDIWR
jgi:hypothetical protein